MGTTDWSAVPDTPGVYVIFDHDEVIYVGMAGRDGKGSLRRRLRDHASGQVVNMFAQYLLFDRILDPADLPRSPQEAGRRCRAHIRQHCQARGLSARDAAEARLIESRLRKDLQPTFNGVKTAPSL
jgi:excinuclease UvrABC nuclease subunit